MPQPNENAPNQWTVIKELLIELVHKFTRKQAYWFYAAIAWIVICAYFVESGKTLNGFPTAWDLRGMLILAVICFFMVFKK